MRERERLEDFQGGGIACRLCKRVMDFGVGLMTPQICCNIAYVPTQRQIDVVIYDRLTADEMAMYAGTVGATVHYQLPPVVIPDEEDGIPEPEVEVEVDEEEVGSMLVSDAEIAARTAERLAQIRNRGRR